MLARRHAAPSGPRESNGLWAPRWRRALCWKPSPNVRSPCASKFSAPPRVTPPIGSWPLLEAMNDRTARRSVAAVQGQDCRCVLLAHHSDGSVRPGRRQRSPPLANHLSPYNMVPGILGEGSLTFWLLVNGVNVQRWKEQASAAGDGR